MKLPSPTLASPEGLVVDGEDGLRNPNWFSIFKIMLAMPRLQSVRLGDLYQCHYKDLPTSLNLADIECFKSNKMMLADGNRESLVAVDNEIQQQLGLAVQRLLTNSPYWDGQGYKILPVWFPPCQ